MTGASEGGQLLLTSLELLFEPTDNLRQAADMRRNFPYAVISAVVSSHSGRGFGRCWAPMWCFSASLGRFGRDSFERMVENARYWRRPGAKLPGARGLVVIFVVACTNWHSPKEGIWANDHNGFKKK